MAPLDIINIIVEEDNLLVWRIVHVDRNTVFLLLFTIIDNLVETAESVNV